MNNTILQNEELTLNPSKPYGATEDFNLSEVPEAIIDTEYTINKKH